MPRSGFAGVLLAALFLLQPGLASAVDNDMDGFHSPGPDCNDNDNTIYPGAPETINDGTDQDCNGGDLCYLDTDNDGARSTVTQSSSDLDCVDAGEAVPSDPIDCNDNNSNISPLDPEVCDASNIDEDCDGFADDSDSGGAAGKTVRYQDNDSDTYGSFSSQARCDAGGGYTATNPSDCNDSDSSIHPGAVETVGDEIDQNCDSDEVCYLDGDSDGDRQTTTISSTDVDCDDTNEAVVGAAIDCDDMNASVNSGATETCDGGDVDEDCDGGADDNDPEGAAGQNSGYVDLDGDGYGYGSSVTTCGPVVASGGDCDETDADRNPGETEDCDDTIDNNCDLLPDCSDSVCSSEPVCIIEVFDHLECYKIKASDKLKGVVDLDPGSRPTFAVAEGCQIMRATKYCVPVMKTVVSLEAPAVEDEDYVGQSLTDDRVCYKLKCPAVELGAITVQDQFGEHTVEKFKVTEICTPANVAP